MDILILKLYYLIEGGDVMLRDKVTKVFNTELIEVGNLITVEFYITGDEGGLEFFRHRNGIVTKVTEDFINFVSKDAINHTVKISDVVNGYTLIKGNITRFE